MWRSFARCGATAQGGVRPKLCRKTCSPARWRMGCRRSASAALIGASASSLAHHRAKRARRFGISRSAPSSSANIRANSTRSWSSPAASAGGDRSMPAFRPSPGKSPARAGTGRASSACAARTSRRKPTLGAKPRVKQQIAMQTAGESRDKGRFAPVHQWARQMAGRGGA